ncbi:hypothetical protein SNE25_12430 [Mucilaginibacter sabulilitoris]|uniref:WD40-like Beta Propeller Repeat n=1 Tax=Mucilaginibacter sabulilitoris TaxID=1173583 RepID=A0ABZ0TZ03_9SPHI|nr:hypothetical protein [Mucilaginibacter sabulilitoris]WPU96325.1 hypothetical protein SNE25_12430 [Mucilaginibacter sabulilitoris]
MKANRFLGLVVLFCVFILTACSKKDSPGPGGGIGPGGATNLGAGTIYYDWADEGTHSINLQTGERGTIMAENLDLDGWDVSPDNKLLLISEGDNNDYDAEQYSITNVANGTLVNRFKWNSGYANPTSPLFSPDGSMIAVPPTYDDGIFLLDLQGRVLHSLATFQGKKINGDIAWMPDKTLVFSVGNNLYRTNTAYTSATLIKQMNFNTWGSITTSLDGTKIAFRGGNHIWMMNADGSGQVQVTESSDNEGVPVFSPDRKYLLIGQDYHQSIALSYVWTLKIIPADGQKYNVDDGADKRVITVITKGQTTPEHGDGVMQWR